MTYSNIGRPQATCWNIPEAFVTYKGNEYRFWAEHELLMDEVSYEFIDQEPPEDFDWQQFEADVREMLDNYEAFCKAQNIEAEKAGAK